jgi:hypothetical protein
MNRDHDGRSAGRATLLVRAVDAIDSRHAQGQLIQRHRQIPAQRHDQRGEHLTARTIMITGHTRTLRDVQGKA